MAERYLKNTGNWNDTNTWAATDDGAAGASFPTSADNVHFTDMADGLTLTVNVASSCLDMVADEANTATLAGGSALSIYGSLTFHANMTISAYTNHYHFRATGAGKTVTYAGLAHQNATTFEGVGGGWTLQDALSIGNRTLAISNGTLDTNGQTVTCATFSFTGTSTRTLTLGASVINCTSLNATTITNLTLNENTSTIKVTGTGAFAGGGETYYNVELNGTAHTVSGDNTFASLTIAGTATVTLGSTTQTTGAWVNGGTVAANTATIIVTGTGVFTGGDQSTYYIVELNGTAHTISGDNTFSQLKIGRATAVTVTGTAASTQTVTTLLLGNTINVVTLDSTGASWTITGNRGYFEGDYMDIADVVATEKSLYYAGDHSTDSTGNTNWIFTRKVRPDWVRRYW